MLKVDSSLNHIPAGPNHVIGLHESINQPLVNIPNFGTAPTAAYVLGTRNDQGAYTVFVYLHQVETRAVIIYVSEPRLLTHEQYRVEEAEALRFVESMGFMVDNLHFPTLAPPEQDTVMNRIPLFRPPQRTVDLYEIQEGTPGSVFGGLSAEDSALVRQAAAGARGPVPGTPIHGAPVMGKPEVPPAHMRPPAADGRPSHGPGPGSNSHAPMGNVVPAPAPSEPPRPTGNVAPAPPPPMPEPDPEALKRLGRILGTFVWVLAALGSGTFACKSSGTPQPTGALTAHIDLGNQQLAQGRWPDAIKAFARALETDESNFEALRGTGLAYLNLGRLPDAEEFYRRSLEANPQSSLSRNELAVVYLQQRRCQDAVPLFEKVLEDIFYPTPEFAEHNLAQAYACLGRVKEALARLDKLVTKRPYFCLGYLTLSRLASESRQPEATIQACDDFAHYCEQNDKIKDQVLPQQSAVCYLRKGLAYAELGDVESARASFERCRSAGEVGRECTKSLELLPQ